jgi:AraC-like DNA-binding protein
MSMATIVAQPSRRVLNESDMYRELPPPPPIAAHVMCLWTREGPAAGRVLPDGCVDIVWTGERLLVAGPATRATVPRVSPDVTKVGVRFRTGAAAQALGLPAAELRDESITLEHIWGARGRELAERAADAPSAEHRLRLLSSAVADAPAPDPLVRAAVRELAAPGVRVFELCKSLFVSERQLRRRIEEAVGYSPRTLARVLRLQRFLMLAERGGDELARLAAEAGYADQSHLTRECSELAGLPAGALLAAGAAPAGERVS